MGTVWIRKVKRGRGDGVWGAYVVDHDEFGTWLFTPERSLFRWSADGRIEICYSGVPEPPGASVLHLIPHEGWWFARWQRLPRPHVAIDICTPAVLIDTTWSYDDLELDLLTCGDGRWELVDEDEFAAAREAGLIEDAEATAARDAADELSARLRAGDALFDSLGWERLDRCIDEPHAPLTSFPSSS